jgi:hypothetical protein
MTLLDLSISNALSQSHRAKIDFLCSEIKFFILEDLSSLNGQFYDRSHNFIFPSALHFFNPCSQFLNGHFVQYKPSNSYRNSTQCVNFRSSKPTTSWENRFSSLITKNVHFGGPYRLWMANVITSSQNFTFQSTFNFFNCCSQFLNSYLVGYKPAKSYQHFWCGSWSGSSTMILRNRQTIDGAARVE